MDTAPYCPGGTCSDPCALGGSAIYFNSSDASETWSYYPSDGYNSAVLDGGSIGSSIGANVGVCAQIGVGSTLTMTGLQFQRFRGVAFYASSGAITLTNNIFHDDSFQTSAFIGDIMIGAGAHSSVQNSNSVITNNYLYNVGNSGIQLSGNSGSNITVANNILVNTCATGGPSGNGDCGAIYDGQGTNYTVTTGHKIINNYVRDVWISNGGVFTGSNGGNGSCIYLDDMTSNITVSGNVCTGLWGIGLFIHCGENIAYQNNIMDLGSTSRALLYDQCPSPSGSTPNTGIQITGNIWVSNGAAGAGYVGAGNTAYVTVSNNAYNNYGGGTINHSCVSGACSSESNATNENPLLHCWEALLASTSPVFGSPVNFAAQPTNRGAPGFWGPPGTKMPHTGTRPSWPTTSGDGVTCPS
jgi:hypothetical protein